MKTYSIQDKYNNDKVWIVKVYCRGQVTFNQEIKGIPVNSAFKPTTKKWVNSVLEINLNDRLSDEEQQELLDSEPPAEYMGQDGTLHTFEDIDPCWEEQRRLDDYHYRVEQEIQDEIDPF